MRRALIIATGRDQGLEGLAELRPACQVPFLDRPFLQHVIEVLVGAGCRQADFVLCRHPEQIEAHFGDGARWGIRCGYYLAGDPERPFGVIRAIAVDDDDEVILVDAQSLPAVPAGWPGDDADWPAGARLLPLAWIDDANRTVPSGWVRCKGSALLGLDGDLTMDAWHAAIGSGLCSGSPCEVTGRPLSIKSYADFLQSLGRALDDETLPLLRTGTMNDPGVRLSHNVVIHPTAIIRPPVFVGGDCFIQRGVTLGPHAMVGGGCVLDERCQLERAAVLPGSYIGETVELRDAIVEHNRVINVRLGGIADISDTFIVAAIKADRRSAARGSIILWLTGVVLLAFGAPVLAAVWLYRRFANKGAVFIREPFVRLPAGGAPAAWKTVFRRRIPGDDGVSTWRYAILTVLPGLLDVAAGRLDLVGLPPRSAEALANLPSDWRELYLTGRVGLFTETEALYGNAAGDDEQYACESIYSATRTLRHDFWILFCCLCGAARRRVKAAAGVHDPADCVQGALERD